MTEALRKPDWIPYYIQRIKGSSAWQLEDFKFCWYWKLLTEAADSDLPGYLPNDVRTLWRLAGARTEKFFRERGGMELVARYFSRTDDGLWIYNDKLLEVLHEQMKKLTRRRKSRLSSISMSLQEFPSYISGEVFQEFVKMREMKKKPMTPYAMKLIIDKLGRLKEQGHDPNKILEAAIANCWTGVWPIDESFNGNGHKSEALVGAEKRTQQERKLILPQGLQADTGMEIMPGVMGNTWLWVLGKLEKKISRHAYDTWFKPTRCLGRIGETVYVQVPDENFGNLCERFSDLSACLPEGTKQVKFIWA